MMLGVEGYGSDDNSDSEPTTRTENSAVTLPSNTVKKYTKRTKKFTIELPKPSAEEDDDEKPAKKPRLDTDRKGAGSSSLVSILPAPKQNNPVLVPPERVLGGGRGPGLVFNADHNPSVVEAEDEEQESKSTPLFMPASVFRGKPNISVEESTSKTKVSPKSSSPAVDFFSLGDSSKSETTSNASKVPSLSSLSSAPKVEEFTPPEPTPHDPYPGYYLLPSGKYAAYDAEYYQTFYKKWQADYNKYVRDLEKGKIKGFEALDEDEATGVNAMEEMEKAKVGIQALEERKALTKGGNEAKAPKMNIKGAALSGRAKSRHQLSTLLTEAYQNREALEDQIAQGRRNRKEAGNKYGF